MAATLFFLLLLFFNYSTINAVFHTATLDLKFPDRPTTALLINSSITTDLSQPTTTGQAALVLPLYHRESVHGSRGAQVDYGQLMLARLQRDVARVESVVTELEGSLGGVRVSRPQEMEGTIISGTKQGSGEYFARVGVGSPPRQAFMAIDTGSDITWLQCRPCTDCYSQVDPVFDPAASSTYSRFSCSSAECQALNVAGCRAGACVYQVSYGDGSYTTGDFASDTISFGSTPAVRTAFGCGHDNEGLFVAAAGLLGLGGGPLSFPSQTRSSSFSYCLPDRDSSSSSTIDFSTGSAAAGGGVAASLLHNPKVDTYRYVDLTGVSVGGRPLPISPTSLALDGNGRGGVIVDSGTAVTRLPSSVYGALRDSFAAGAGNLRSAGGFSLFDTCYDLSGMGNTVQVPAVSLVFGNGRKLDLPAKNYMTAVDSAGKYCLAFAGSSGPVSIIGNIQQQGIRVGFNLANSVVTFAPNSC